MSACRGGIAQGQPGDGGPTDGEGDDNSAIIPIDGGAPDSTSIISTDAGLPPVDATSGDSPAGGGEGGPSDSGPSSSLDSGPSSSSEGGLDSGSAPTDASSSSSVCSAPPGQFPVANCLPFPASDEMCNSPPLSCPTTPCNTSSPCLAMGTDNTGQSLASLRMRKLLVTSPPALAFQPPSRTFVQKVIFDESIDLDNQCGEPGTGTFNWLLQVNLAQGTITTGGAPPPTDPFGAGYCFVDEAIGAVQVAPVTVHLTTNADGTLSSAIMPKLYVPMFMAQGSTPSVIVWPLSQLAFHDITLSSDENCIGHYNPDAVTPATATTCVDTHDTTCVRWTTAGSLGGFITLNDANGVDIPQLAESLCVLLAPNGPVDTSNPNEKLCGTDANGNVIATGDFCSTTDSPGGCADSVWFSATFAASAAVVSATPNQPECMGQ